MISTPAQSAVMSDQLTEHIGLLLDIQIEGVQRDIRWVQTDAGQIKNLEQVAIPTSTPT
jgi:hypothetical protein